MKNTAELEGWTFMGIYDEPRLSEIRQTYIHLGFRVKCLNREMALLNDCSRCLENHSPKYKALYTKKAETDSPG